MPVGLHIVRLFLLSLLSLLIGFGAQETLDARNAFDVGTGAIVALSLLLLVGWCLRPRRINTAWLETELLVLWAVFFLTWAGNDGVGRYEAIDLLPIGYVACAVCLGGCHRLACRLYAGWRTPPGARCPNCGYCLIGLRDHRCPECGRPFLLEELDLSEANLRPATPAAASRRAMP